MKIVSGKAKLNMMVGLVLVGLCACFFAIFGADTGTAEWVVNKTGYYFVAVPFLAFIVMAFRVVRIDVPKPQHLGWLLTAIVSASVLLFIHEDLGPKIAMDDYVLASTAKSLAQEREVEVLTLGRNFNEYFIRADSYVDKRPWLYPFLVSIAHDLTGYRIENSFIVNACCAVFLLSLTALFAYRLGGLPAGVLAPFLWASLPLLSQNAFGGGLDMLNVTLLFVLTLCGLYYLHRPGPERLSLLVLAMVLLSYTRYESVLFWLPVFGIVLAGWFREKRIILSYAFSLVPCFLVALAALHNYISNSPALWELPDNLTQRFSIAYITPNVLSALYFFLNLGDELSNSFLLAIVGIPCAVLLLTGAVRSIRVRDSNRYQSFVFLAMGLSIIAYVLLIMAYHDGQLDEKISSRFSLPLYLSFVLSIVLVLSNHFKKSRDWCIASIMLAVFMLGIALPNKAKGIYSKRNFVVREAEWLSEQADSSFKPMSLVVDSEPIIWTLDEWHCITALEAVSNLARIHAERKRGKFPEIYLVDRSSAVYDPENQIRFVSDFEYVGFEKILIAERSFAPLRMTRIYKAGAIAVPEDSAASLSAGLETIEMPLQPVERDHPED